MKTAFPVELPPKKLIAIKSLKTLKVKTKGQQKEKVTGFLLSRTNGTMHKGKYFEKLKAKIIFKE